MKWSVHFVVGATVGLIFAKYTGTDYTLMGLTGALFGVLPDADIMLDAVGIARHRGAYSHSIFSSILFGIIVGPVAYFLFSFSPKTSVLLGLLASAASFSHVLTDTLTYSGVRIFWPFSKKKYRGFIKYDNIPANLLIIVLCLLLLYLTGIIPDEAVIFNR